MSEILNRNTFFVKEHVGMFKASVNYDVFCPETQVEILKCREENLGFFTKMFRFTKYKRVTPFNVLVNTLDDKQVIRIEKSITLWLASIKIYDDNDVFIGIFKQRFSFLTSKIDVLDTKGNKMFFLKGKWTGWEFKFLDENKKELAFVTKKWAGLGKEMFTSADNYMLSISEDVEPDSEARRLILASIFCIDIATKS